MKCDNKEKMLKSACKCGKIPDADGAVFLISTDVFVYFSARVRLQGSVGRFLHEHSRLLVVLLVRGERQRVVVPVPGRIRVRQELGGVQAGRAGWRVHAATSVK